MINKFDYYIKLGKVSDLEDSYESVREAAQALMSIKGFKPYSHITK